MCQALVSGRRSALETGGLEAGRRSRKLGDCAKEESTDKNMNETIRTACFLMMLTFLPRYRFLDALAPVTNISFLADGQSGFPEDQRDGKAHQNELINQLVRLSATRVGCKLLWFRGGEQKMAPEEFSSATLSNEIAPGYGPVGHDSWPKGTAGPVSARVSG